MPVPVESKVVFDTLIWAGVPEDTAHLATGNLLAGNARLIAVTGKLASGKDTVAPLLVANVVPGGAANVNHEFFAKALKDEVSEVITYLTYAVRAGRVSSSGLVAQEIDTLVQELSVFSGISVTDAEVVVTRLLPEVLGDNPPSDAYVRTPGVRRVLQYWGTDIRRKHDDAYWVRKTIKRLSSVLAAGRSVYVTDARFMNEIETLRSLGAFLSRLDITEEVQAQRLYSRDGLVLTDEAKNHRSETELDDYDHFDLRVDNNVTGAEALSDVVTALTVAFNDKYSA